MTRVDVFADIVCPFTHVGLRRLSEARHARAVDLSLHVHAWPLEWINGAPLGPELLVREIDALRASVAPDLFSGFDAALFPLTSIPAFGLVAAGYEVDDAIGAALSMALRDALFEQGEDISRDDILWEIGRRFDIDAPDLAATEAAVRHDWDLGKMREVLGSPHFFVGDRGWFCPSLDIHHGDGRFEVMIAGDTMRDFYAAALE